MAHVYGLSSGIKSYDDQYSPQSYNYNYAQKDLNADGMRDDHGLFRNGNLMGKTVPDPVRF